MTTARRETMTIGQLLRVAAEHDLDPPEALTYAAIIAGLGGGRLPDRGRLAELARMGREAVDASIEALEEAGLIRRGSVGEPLREGK